MRGMRKRRLDEFIRDIFGQNAKVIGKELTNIFLELLEINSIKEIESERNNCFRRLDAITIKSGVRNLVAGLFKGISKDLRVVLKKIRNRIDGRGAGS